MVFTSKARWRAFLFLAGVVAVGTWILNRAPSMSLPYQDEQAQDEGQDEGPLTKRALAMALGDAGVVQRFPSEMDMPIDGRSSRVIVQYSFDPALQEAMENHFRSHQPDHGAFVAIDARTGRILSLVSYTRDSRVHDNLALRATFPSASVFKVVTAAAAIAERNFSADTVIPFNGRNHTLYRSHILRHDTNRWTRYMTLREAFGLSVNTVFGKIGAHTVGAQDLRSYAERFGFNRPIRADLPVQEGRADFSDDPWSLAEAASGYTRDNTMSPLQGALIAAAIVNDGMMMEPYVVQSVHAMDGSELYRARARLATRSVPQDTAAEIRSLMRHTVTRGTSKRAFRGFFRGAFADLDVGGKTGSLTGKDPPGKYDWFVGYADSGDTRIAIAALSIHGKFWRVKSSQVARSAIERYFRQKGASRHVVHAHAGL